MGRRGEDSPGALLVLGDELRLLSADFIAEAVACLRAGYPVAFPTETVYGLGAPIGHRETVEQIFRMKGRPSDNPLICHVGAPEDMQFLGREIPPLAHDLVDCFWPGPLTLVVKKQSHVLDCVTAGLETVAIRMPDHPVALALIRAVGEPLAAPSANISGRPSSTAAAHVMADFADCEGVVIDGGPCAVGIESTVVLVEEDEVVILRPGTIGVEDLRAVVGKVRLGGTATRPMSPGTRYRHYAPRASVRLEEAPIAPSDAHILYLSTRELVGFETVTEYNLYDWLREADRRNVRDIVVVCQGGSWDSLAFRDRLQKAALR